MTLDFETLLDEAFLGDLLQRATASAAKGGPCAVGVTTGGRRSIAFFPDMGGACGFEADMKLGCLMKLFTATLVAQAVYSGELTWSTPVFEALGVHPQKHFENVTIQHLLNHTHGWDDSGLTLGTFTLGGCIDAARLFEALMAAPPLSQVGQHHSYGNAGAWISAALLERVTGRAYSQLLFDRLAHPLEIVPRTQQPPASLCPAADPCFAIPMRGALSFLESHLGNPHQQASALSVYPFEPGSLRSSVLPLPGWSPAERFICLGWKCFGGSWYGHNAQTEDYAALMRVNPEKGIGLAFFGASYTVFSRLFARTLPEFSEFRMPQKLRSEELSQSNWQTFEGTFENRTTKIILRAEADSGLRYRIVSAAVTAGQAGNTEEQSLAAAQDNLFFPVGAAQPELPFLQLIRPDAAGLFRYLWNGRSVLRRADVAGDPARTNPEPQPSSAEPLEVDWDRLMGRC
jgi:hypothetical protein